MQFLHKTQSFIPQEPYTIHSEWETPDFKTMPDQQPSPCIKEYNHFWKLVVFKKGNGAEKGKSVSIFLMHPQCKFAHEVSYQIKTIGPKSASFEGSWVFSPMLNNQGIEKFIPLNEIDDYLNNGKLKFDITIKFDPPQPATKISCRESVGLVGLTNLGATCYLNSMLQCLFHTPAFRRAVYDMPTDGTEDVKTSIAYSLQRLFTLMQMSPLTPSTQELTTSFGWGITDQFSQHDVQEFLRVLVDNLEKKLKKTDKKDAFANIFRGKTTNKLFVEKFDYKDDHKEEFYDIELVVRNNRDLVQAIREYTKAEVIDEYKVENKGVSQAIKTTKFWQLPNVLHFLLQRFEYNPMGNGMIKVNDRFEFPDELDMKEFMDPESEDKDTVYDLFGVLIHIGFANAGHYEAMMKIEGNWYLFNDDEVTKVPESTVRTTFGGENTYGSAYFVTYVRRSQKDLMTAVLDSEIPDHLHKYLDEYIKEHTWKSPETNIEVHSDILLAEELAGKAVEYPVLTVPLKGYKVKDCLSSLSALTNIKQPIQLFTVDIYGIPESPIQLSQDVQKQFSKSSKLFVSSTTDKGTIPVVVGFYDPSQNQAVSYLFTSVVEQGTKVCNFISKVSATAKTIKLLAFKVRGCSASKLDLESTINAPGLILFQHAEKKSAPKSITCQEFKPGNTYRSIDVVPELRNSTVDVFLAGLEDPLTFSLTNVTNHEHNFKLTISAKGHISTMIKSIRSILKIPNDKAVLLFRSENGSASEVPISCSTNANIRQLISSTDVFYLIHPGISQSEIETQLFFQPDIITDTGIKSPVLLMPKDFTAGDVFTKLIKKNIIGNKSGWRMLMLEGCRIVKVVPDDSKLENMLTKKFRIEKIPSDQLPPAKTVRVTLSTLPSNPRNNTTGIPFIFTLIKGEKFPETKKRLLEQSSADPEKARFGYTNDTSNKHKSPKDDDELFDLIETNGMLYIFVPGEIKTKNFHKSGNGFQIYN
ncbi:Clan CA, family C19, ubiquitin hydrolase-like cysteine peptidase [Trichomonas vaginalis G3]|uniref:Ubiquitin carboxyl-terminal hydrolase n=1 Tax=Trichomonas vaginalis (strain ATCC PRA-98 / G3) TaxID=412133 RepID=A2G6C6_TRIV3|nr:ubiquitinyl hydrolase protein [Trichomonas vaginalis G3]EAX87286.1 Clan CA, family C19, ubiquitin hydrolase-like cysteine peptidase [Trichomonas vaginalis G3]KAI5534536.1 ubiquitinyl hydrolase protein [Trichomonas vaginalis G3]|eukprot:XP_001300216.1 Clan CA, family C19, ubiquitin hydrolase-like cysteine peptidase [Trichomonas vaginalis G3]